MYFQKPLQKLHQPTNSADPFHIQKKSRRITKNCLTKPAPEQYYLSTVESTVETEVRKWKRAPFILSGILKPRKSEYALRLEHSYEKNPSLDCYWLYFMHLTVPSAILRWPLSLNISCPLSFARPVLVGCNGATFLVFRRLKSSTVLCRIYIKLSHIRTWWMNFTVIKVISPTFNVDCNWAWKRIRILYRTLVSKWIKTIHNTGLKQQPRTLTLVLTVI